MGGEKIKWHQLAHHQLMFQPSISFLSTQVQLKPMTKAQISGRMFCNGTSDVATASVNSEKTCLKKLMMMMNVIINITSNRKTIY